ncbi:MAG: HNH endonuclease [Flavobacteriales bacterium]|jgi:5-methylcytosine-specific restriction endonuclease McrA|nr:HNH endonuclease [Flavobacteriales bacterium]
MSVLLDEVRVFPTKTFFGLDKAEGQCFTLKKIYYSHFINVFNLSGNNLQKDAKLFIKGKSYPFTIRLIRMDRSKVRKLLPKALGKREIIQFSWKTSADTQIAIREALPEAFKILKDGKRNIEYEGIFKHLGDSQFELIHQSLNQKNPNDVAEEFEERIKGNNPIVPSIRISDINMIQMNVPSSFVNQNLKLAEDRGHGEAKLYVGPVRRQDEFDKFMLDWHPMNTYEIDHIDLLLYMQEVEPEYSRQGKYKSVSKRLFNELFQKVEQCSDLRVALSKHTDSSRYYIRGQNSAWALLREICIPLMTTIAIERKEVLDGFADYKIRVSIAKQVQTKNPTSGQRIGTKKRRKVKRKQKDLVPPLDSRTISSELKDKIWRRDQGMCQANWRIDSSLDKNLGDICGSNENIEFDHIVPFSRGGKTTYRNLQLLCRRHNRMKGVSEI